MEKIYALPCLIFVLVFSCAESYGQTTIHAEIRPRSEYRQGFNQPLVGSG